MKTKRLVLRVLGYPILSHDGKKNHFVETTRFGRRLFSFIFLEYICNMHNPKPPVRLRADRFTFTVMQVFDDVYDAVEQELSRLHSLAPKFFEQAPIVVDCRALSINAKFCAALFTAIRRCGAFPIALLSQQAELRTFTQAESVPLLAYLADEQAIALSEKTDQVAEDKIAKQGASLAKIIRGTVRSGQQIYARDTDLIVVGSVSPGAEVLADGNIHIYGTLSGRALAGMNGYEAACIFCKKLNAELVSIAGYYQANEDFCDQAGRGDLCIYLEAAQLHVLPL